MPAVNTMIHDLQTKALTGVSGLGLVGAKGTSVSATLSDFYRITYASRPVKLGISAGPPQTLSATDSPMWGDAQYLMFQLDWSTVADLTRTHRAVVGGGYSGCLYSVYKTQDGKFKCVHTSRSSDVALSDGLVAGLRSYAADQRWTLIHEVPTIGLVENALTGGGVPGCRTVFLATRVDYTITPTPVVNTVRLAQDANGRTVGIPFEVNTPS